MAERMLRSITIRYVEGDEVKTARAFQITQRNAYSDEPRKYKTFSVLHGDTLFAASMMDRALDDLVTWRTRYAPYTDMWVRFGDVFQVVVNQISEFQDEFLSKDVTAGTDDALVKLLTWKEDCRAILETWIAAREQVKYIMDAISEAETIFGRLRQQDRDCMTCGKTFKSFGPGHRLCDKCSKTPSGLDELSVA
jgi:hypothetical protein